MVTDGMRGVAGEVLTGRLGWHANWGATSWGCEPEGWDEMEEKKREPRPGKRNVGRKDDDQEAGRGEGVLV